MHKTITKKPTDQELADYFGLSRATVSSYKHGDEKLQRRYRALVGYYQQSNCCEKLERIREVLED